MKAKTERGLATVQDSFGQVALLIWEVGASKGGKESQFYLAEAYEEGKGGVTQSLAFARFWYEQSAAQGHKEAQSALNRIKSI